MKSEFYLPETYQLPIVELFSYLLVSFLGAIYFQSDLCISDDSLGSEESICFSAFHKDHDILIFVVPASNCLY